MARRLQYLIFLPNLPHKDQPVQQDHGAFSVTIAGPGLSQAFLAFDGILVLAGSFETVSADPYSGRRGASFNSGQLDRRDLEASTALSAGRSLVFLVPPIERAHHQTDLFRRVVEWINVQWGEIDVAIPSYDVKAPEFADYCRTYGSASVWYSLYHQPSAVALAEAKQGQVLGFAFDNLFCLPCHQPGSGEQFVSMALTALEAVAEYRNNHADDLPEWIDDVVIGKEAALLTSLEEARAVVQHLDDEIYEYRQAKSILCLKGDLLVQRVADVLRRLVQAEVRCDDIKSLSR